MQTAIPTAHLLHHRIKILDGFRGLAILLVCAYHYLEVFSFGWMGVDLFFVLSGFLITGKLTAAAGTKNYFIAFYLKRILRIAPLYYLILLIFFVGIPLLLPAYTSSSFKELLQQQIYYWTFTVNIYDALKGWPRNVTLIHFWSLACEMQFYLLWPFVLYFFYARNNTRSIMAACIIIFVMAFLIRIGATYFAPVSVVYRYVMLPCRLDAFVAGAFLNFLMTASAAGYPKLMGSIAVVSALIIVMQVIITGNRWHFGNPLVSSYGFTVNAVFWSSCMGFVLMRNAGAWKRFFTAGVLTELGKYSYGIYVFHWPVYVIIARQHLFNASAEEKTWLLAVVAFAITCLCSFARYHLVEKHFLKLKPAH